MNHPVQEFMDANPYPEYPVIVASVNISEAQKRELANNYRIQRIEYRAQISQIECVKFAEWLANTFKITNPKQAAKMFHYAWEHGHSEGLSKVYDIYQELAEIVIA